VFEPDNAPPNDSTAPEAALQLEWVYGYRCQVILFSPLIIHWYIVSIIFVSQGVRANTAIDSRGRLIYPSAAVVVALDTRSNTQEHFIGHNDDVTWCESPVDFAAYFVPFIVYVFVFDYLPVWRSTRRVLM
jgi:hypothetical protein